MKVAVDSAEVVRVQATTAAVAFVAEGEAAQVEESAVMFSSLEAAQNAAVEGVVFGEGGQSGGGGGGGGGGSNDNDRGIIKVAM